jgi:ABC-type sugar transport system substrate-binding protein
MPLRRSGKTRKHTKASTLVVVAIAIAFLVAACSSGSSSSSASSSGGSTSSASAQPGVTWADALVAKYQTRPTQIPVTTPFTKPIPKGKKVIFISCGAAACILESNIIKAATNLLGWQLQTINTDGSVGQFKNAWSQAVTEKPAAVLYTAIDLSVFKTQLAQLKAEGTAVATCCVTYSAGNGVNAVLDGSGDNNLQGQMQAAWMIQDSNGTGHALFVNLPSYDILDQLAQGFASATAAHCPSCSSHELDIPLSQIANKNSTIISYLLAHRTVKYVAVAVDDLAVGLPSALKAAGLGDVKIIGDGANTTTLGYIQDGQIAEDISFPYYEVMWTMVDSVARVIAGEPVPTYGSMGYWMMNKSNIPSGDTLFPMVPDYKSQYEKVWSLSS